MAKFSNPFRPGAGHPPPYLAGRDAERGELIRLLGQRTILENLVLTGLRGVGKTVLLDSFKPLAVERGWAWVGTDVSEAASISEDRMAVRLCTDLAPLTADLVAATEQVRSAGFAAAPEEIEYPLGYDALIDHYQRTPGLSLDKIKAVLELAWSTLSRERRGVRGIVFAYDEAQNLSDQSAREQYPLSMLLDTFQSLQRKGLPLMLVLTGLPTLFPKLVQARTFAERMFRVRFLSSLTPVESAEAIRRPLADADCPVRLSDPSVDRIIDMAGGYPYFIQFICREVYDAFIQRIDRGEEGSILRTEIERKLDADFFAGRWARATDRQRDLLFVIARLDHCDEEFTVQEVVEESGRGRERPFGSSHVNQMLAALAAQGLVYKNRRARYSFAVPLLGRFIRRQAQEAAFGI